MKTIAFYVLAVSIQLSGSSQEKSKFDTLFIKTSAQCEMCKETIEEALAFTPGVKKSNLDMENKFVKVVYRPSKTTYHKICVAISDAGYNADSLKADPKAYDQLPACCKYRKE
jgi:copper chaperone CopZ